MNFRKPVSLLVVLLLGISFSSLANSSMVTAYMSGTIHSGYLQTYGNPTKSYYYANPNQTGMWDLSITFDTASLYVADQNQLAGYAPWEMVITIDGVEFDYTPYWNSFIDINPTSFLFNLAGPASWYDTPSYEVPLSYNLMNGAEIFSGPFPIQGPLIDTNGLYNASFSYSNIYGPYGMVWGGSKYLQDVKDIRNPDGSITMERDIAQVTLWVDTIGISQPPIPVPEPAGLALMGLGLVGLGFAQRRKNTA